MLEITKLRHAWPEKAGFDLERKNGYPEYTFLHFFNSVDILVNGEMIHTAPHACILYQIGTPQHLISKDPLMHDWIHFAGDLDAHFLRYGLHYDTVYYPVDGDFITEITREMEFEWLSGKENCRELLQVKTDELFIKLYRASTEPNSVPVGADIRERFRILRGEVFSNLRNHWTIEEMAGQVGLSKSRFYTLYRSIYGNSPMDDLIHARIDHAKNALQYTSVPIGEIAESIGYGNLTHFMRQFKSLTGISPGKYRKVNSEIPTAAEGGGLDL